MAKLETFVLIPKDSRKDATIGYEMKQIARCKECRYSKKAYHLAGFVICGNRNSPCHTGVVEKTFFCEKGEVKKDGGQE